MIKIKTIMAVLTLTAAALGTLLLGSVLFAWAMASPQEADVIIILGAAVWPDEQPSIALRERLDVALEVWEKGLATHIICSGGIGTYPPSEAEVMARWLMDRGVPEEAIILEVQARNTQENMLLSKGIMEERGWERAIVVSHGFHIRRSLLMAKEAGLQEVSAAPVQIIPGRIVWYLLRETAALANYYRTRIV